MNLICRTEWVIWRIRWTVWIKCWPSAIISVGLIQPFKRPIYWICTRRTSRTAVRSILSKTLAIIRQGNNPFMCWDRVSPTLSAILSLLRPSRRVSWTLWCLRPTNRRWKSRPAVPVFRIIRPFDPARRLATTLTSSCRLLLPNSALFALFQVFKKWYFDLLWLLFDYFMFLMIFGVKNRPILNCLTVFLLFD